MRTGLGVMVPLTLMATPAAAQHIGPVEELAPYLAYDFCLDYLDGNVSLANNESLPILGFGAVTTTQDPKAGAVESVTRVRSDGTTTVRVYGGAFCEVTVAGGNSGAATMAAFKSGLADFDLPFVRDKQFDAEFGAFSVSTYKATLAPGAVLRVRLVDALASHDRAVTYQIFIREQ